MTEYSLVDNVTKGFVEKQFTQIKKGDNFVEQGDDTIYRAQDDVKLTPAGDIYFVIGEDEEFNTKVFGHGKNSLGYAPKYFVLAKPIMETPADDSE